MPHLSNFNENYIFPNGDQLIIIGKVTREEKHGVKVSMFEGEVRGINQKKNIQLHLEMPEPAPSVDLVNIILRFLDSSPKILIEHFYENQGVMFSEIYGIQTYYGVMVRIVDNKRRNYCLVQFSENGDMTRNDNLVISEPIFALTQIIKKLIQLAEKSN